MHKNNLFHFGKYLYRSNFIDGNAGIPWGLFCESFSLSNIHSFSGAEETKTFSSSVESIKSLAAEDVENFQNEHLNEHQRLPSLTQTGTVSNLEVGLPLRVFGRGNLCHPYLSLSFIDTLSQACVRGYLIGATNALFKQKAGVAEVIIDIEKDKVDILDPDLKKALTLTTEDLRFIDHIIKQVSIENGSDIFLDGVGWEGGDEWVRAQFRMYILCLLRTVLNSDQDSTSIYELHRFNSSFVNLWKKTMNFKLWREHVSSESTDLEAFINLPPLHPCSGQLSINDMRLHLSNTITNTEGGKKVSQAVANTGRAVAGGFSTAKGVFSSWVTSFKTNPNPGGNDETSETATKEDDAVVEAVEASEKQDVSEKGSETSNNV